MSARFGVGGGGGGVAVSVSVVIVVIVVVVVVVATMAEPAHAQGPAEPALTARGTVRCRDEKAPVPRFKVVGAGRDIVRFTAAQNVANTCQGISVVNAFSDDVEAASLTVNITSNAVVSGACEVVCPGLAVVDGSIENAAPLQHLSVTIGGRALSAERDKSGWHPQTAMLTVTSTPSDAAVYIDRTVRGRTPLTLANLPAGPVNVEVVKGDGLRAQQSTVLKPGAASKLALKLKVDRGLIDENSRRPVIGDIRVNDDSRGNPGPSGADVTRVLQQQQPAIRTCVERGQKNGNVPPQGKQRLLISVEPSGRVSEARFKNPTVTASDAGTCIVVAARKWKFPPFPGETAALDIPMILALP